MNCTIEYISNLNTILDKCNYVKRHCPSEYINTYSLYYCLFKGKLFISIPTFTFIILILFILLSSTSDIFLGPSITKIVEIFKINQNIAALTLLAFGNGAPDVISSLVASNNIEGIEFSLGNMIGGGIFVTSFGFALVCYYGKDIKISPKMFKRDIILYIITLIFIVIISFDGKIYFIESLGFIGIYCGNIFLAIYQEKYGKKKKKKNKLLEKEEKENENQYQRFSNLGKNLIDIEKNLNNKQIDIELEEKTDNIDNYNEINGINKKEKNNLKNKDNINSYISNERKISKNNEINIEKKNIYKENFLPEVNYNESECSTYILGNLQSIKFNFKKKFFRYKEKDWEKASRLRIFFYLLIEYPLLFIREMTIPSSDPKIWSKSKFCLMPINCFFFTCLSLNCKLFIYL